jgi:hypothetical protein
MVHFWSNNGHFCSIVVNNINLNLSIKISYYINTMIMDTFVNLHFENNAFIISNGLLKFKNIDWLTN